MFSPGFGERTVNNCTPDNRWIELNSESEMFIIRVYCGQNIASSEFNGSPSCFTYY